MKTDLQKILSISGESGLFEFVSQAKSGIIAESIITKKRSMFGIQAKVTSLSDISIYTDDQEVPLKEVFEKMKESLGEENAPDPKSDPKLLISFFEKVLPNYDKEKFYVSHMKKVVQWYNLLKEYASLEFTQPEDNTQESEGDAAKE